MDTLELAKKIAHEAHETKAKDLKVLDLQGLVSFTDYFVLATATSTRHSQAMADRVYLKIKKDLGRLPISYEGHASGQWVLLDYGDVVLHVFLPDQRELYGLDEFWVDAPEIPLFPKGKKTRGRVPSKKRAAKPKTKMKRKKNPKKRKR